MTPNTVAEIIEDLFSQRGLPTRVVLNNSIGEALHEVVFPMGKERALVDLLGDANQLLRLLLQDASAQLTPRTVLFHWAYELFGELRTPTVFLSINIRNLQKPRERLLSYKRTTKGVLPVQLKTKWKATVQDYDMDAVLVSTEIGEAKRIVPRLASIVGAFNATSRFLKIGKLRWGWSRSKMLETQPVFHPVSIPLDIG